MANTTFKGPVRSENGFASLGGTSALGTATVGAGTALTKIVKGTVSVDLLSLATVTAADLAVTVTGAAVGDSVIMHPPATAITAGLLVCQCWVSATDTITVRVYNGSAGTIDAAAATWIYTLIRS